MKNIIIPLVLSLVLVFCGVQIFKHVHRVPYTVNAICKEKFPQYRETAAHNYVVIFQYDNGDVEEKGCNVKEYTGYEVNTKYTFTRYKYVWK